MVSWPFYRPLFLLGLSPSATTDSILGFSSCPFVFYNPGKGAKTLGDWVLSARTARSKRRGEKLLVPLPSLSAQKNVEVRNGIIPPRFFFFHTVNVYYRVPFSHSGANENCSPLFHVPPSDLCGSPSELASFSLLGESDPAAMDGVV